MGFLDCMLDFINSAEESKFYEYLSEFEYETSYTLENIYNNSSGDICDLKRQAALFAYIRISDHEYVDDEDFNVSEAKTYVNIKNMYFPCKYIEGLYDARIRKAMEELNKFSDCSEDALVKLVNNGCRAIEERNSYANPYETVAAALLLMKNYSYKKSSFSSETASILYDIEYCPQTRTYRLV